MIERQFNKSKFFVVIMGPNLHAGVIIFVSMVLCMKHLVLGLLNKMDVSNASIGIYLMWHMLCSFKLIFLLNSGEECILTVRYLINHTPSFVLHGKTPYEILHGRPPLFRHLRVFGCLCYTHNQNHKGNMFASRSRKCIFMGYPYGKKGRRVYDLESGMFLVSRNVVFCENKFPYHYNTLGVEVSVQHASEPSAMEVLGDVDNSGVMTIDPQPARVTTIDQLNGAMGATST